MLLDGSAIEILRTIEDYRKSGLTLTEAVERILEEVGGNHRKTAKENTEKDAHGEVESSLEAWCMLIAEKEKRISDLEKTISLLETDRGHWRDLALDYKRQLAPPQTMEGEGNGKRKHWWWFRRRAN